MICVGEIRDAETAAMALQASHTGHMVLATLHSNDNLSTDGVMEAAGCEKCRDTGYDGRVAIFDVLKMNEEIRKTLFSGPIDSIEECRELGSGIIKSRLRKEALKAVVSGLTSLDEVKSVL